MTEELSRDRRVVGAKETRRAIAGGRAVKVFLASDADPALTGPIARQAEEAGLPVDASLTMARLGAACGIAVGAGVAALVK